MQTRTVTFPLSPGAQPEFQIAYQVGPYTIRVRAGALELEGFNDDAATTPGLSGDGAAAVALVQALAAEEARLSAQLHAVQSVRELLAAVPALAVFSEEDDDEEGGADA